MMIQRTVRPLAAVIAAVCLLSSVVSAFDKIELTPDDGKTAQIVASMTSSRHINHPEINDTVSEQLFDRYIQVWDPQKLYFLDSDITEFSVDRTSLDDKIIKGDVQFAVTVFDRFRQRMKEQESKIGALIDAEHDFAVEEEMIRDPKELKWAADDAELQERWRKRVFPQWVLWLTLLGILGMAASIIFIPYILLPIWLIAVSSLFFLAILGAVAARAGGASMLKGSIRVLFWGTIAMTATALVGKLFGAVV